MADEWRGILTFESIEAGRAVFYCDDETAFKVGVKYVAVLTEIPDEAPRGEDRRASTASMASPAAVAEKLCRDPGFSQWARDELTKLGRGIFEAGFVTSRRFVFETCGVTEFTQLDLDPRALAEFRDRVETPYYRFRVMADREPK